MGAMARLMDKHCVRIRRSRTEIHRDKCVAEMCNITLVERMFSYQYANTL